MSNVLNDYMQCYTPAKAKLFYVKFEHQRRCSKTDYTVEIAINITCCLNS